MEEINFYKKRGKGKRKNTQPHPIELNLQIINQYKAGNTTYRALSKTYGIEPGLIAGWVKKFEGRQSKDKDVLR